MKHYILISILSAFIFAGLASAQNSTAAKDALIEQQIRDLKYELKDSQIENKRISNELNLNKDQMQFIIRQYDDCKSTSQQDQNLIIALVTLIVAGLGVAAPWIINFSYKKSIEKLINAKTGKIEEDLEEVKKLKAEVSDFKTKTEQDLNEIKELKEEIKSLKTKFDEQERSAAESAKQAEIQRCFAEALKETDLIKQIEWYDKIIALDPNYANAYNNRGLAKQYLKQFNDAIKDLDEAINLDSNLEIAYNNRGMAKSSLMDYNGAIQDYNKAIELNPNYTIAYNNRGVTKHNMEQLTDAINDFTNALKLDPNLVIAYSNRAKAYTLLADQTSDEVQKNEYLRLAQADEEKAEKLKHA